MPKHPNTNQSSNENKRQEYKTNADSFNNNKNNQSNLNTAHNRSKISLNIDEDPFITKIDDDFSSKITSKSKLKDILNCDEEYIENVEEKAKVEQIKNM